jgi:hypothetical protein
VHTSVPIQSNNASPRFETMIITLIVVGSLKLVVETYIDSGKNASLEKVLESIDIAFNILFTCEAVLKIMRNGFFVAKTSYLRDSWSQLDFFIVSVSLVDMSLSSIDLPFLKVA